MLVTLALAGMLGLFASHAELRTQLLHGTTPATPRPGGYVPAPAGRCTAAERAQVDVLLPPRAAAQACGTDP